MMKIYEEGEEMGKTLLDALGIKMVETSDEKAVATMEVNEKTRQPYGYLHGGASVALAETVASFGTAYFIDLEKQTCFGLEINANHLRSKQEGIVTATAIPIHKGKTTMVWSIEITDEEGKLICISRCTVAIKDKR